MRNFGLTLVLIGTAFLTSKSMLYSQTSTIIPLKELENPYYLIANKDFLLILDNHKVRMYAMKDFKHITNYNVRNYKQKINKKFLRGGTESVGQWVSG